MLLADVSGHGTGAASLAFSLRELMRRNVNVISQTGFVREMNQQFAAQPKKEGFATALVSTFFAPTRSLQFCSAGHPSPLIYRAAQDAWFTAMDCVEVNPTGGLSDIPFGVVEQTDYSLYQTKLERDDMMLSVSDAFTESRDANNSLLGIEGLRRVVCGLSAGSAETLLADLVHAINQLNPDNLHHDDATAIVFRADGSQVSLSHNLMAPFRLLTPVRDNTNLSF